MKPVFPTDAENEEHRADVDEVVAHAQRARPMTISVNEHVDHITLLLC